MRLYATVSSERASKGQGGNGLLTITLYNEERQPLADILFTKCEHKEKCGSCRHRADFRIFQGKIHAEVLDYPSKELPPYLNKKGKGIEPRGIEPRGKKQKGESVLMCLWCKKRKATHKDWREIDGMTTSTRECDECSTIGTYELLEKNGQ